MRIPVFYDLVNSMTKVLDVDPPVMRVSLLRINQHESGFPPAPDRVGGARLLKTNFQKCSTRLDQTLGKDSQGVFIFERKPQVLPGFMGFPVTTMIEKIYSVEVTVILTPWTGGLPW